MDYKSAVASLEIKEPDVPKSTLVKLTNPFRFEKEVKVETATNERLLEIARTMRQRWEAYHLRNGTWYDYSDEGSWYSDEEEEWEEEEEEKCWD